MNQYVLILDFGSQYTHLIKSKLRDMGFNSYIEPGDSKVKILSKYNKVQLKGIILSGGAQSVYEGKIHFEKEWLKIDIPILGICFGHQLIASIFGGKVNTFLPEFGRTKIKLINNSEIFKGIKKEMVVWMSHNDNVISLPEHFKELAISENNRNIIFQHDTKAIYGLQFHPEVAHTEMGNALLKNFVNDICQCVKTFPWNPRVQIENISEKYVPLVGKEKILVAVSGGVDSMTLLATMAKILKRTQLIACYIDTGLMPDETKSEVASFCKKIGVKYIYKDSSSSFFRKLRKISNPSKKGIVIGKLFIKEFESIAEGEDVGFLAQGTIWSDVIESGVTKFSSRIKPHHNVVGLPRNMKLVLVEPFRELFKDQVRKIATYLQLDSSIVNKKVFPGPGFSIRIQGEVTKEKVEIVKKCTKIIEDVLKNSNNESEFWMAFAILINVPSLGIKGDKRVKNDHAIVVRVVESQNSLTANFSQKVFPKLEEISTRIVNETNIGRVVYDITNKPPATIEWQ